MIGMNLLEESVSQNNLISKNNLAVNPSVEIKEHKSLNLKQKPKCKSSKNQIEKKLKKVIMEKVNKFHKSEVKKYKRKLKNEREKSESNEAFTFDEDQFESNNKAPRKSSIINFIKDRLASQMSSKLVSSTNKSKRSKTEETQPFQKLESNLSATNRTHTNDAKSDRPSTKTRHIVNLSNINLDTESLNLDAVKTQEQILKEKRLEVTRRYLHDMLLNLVSSKSAKNKNDKEKDDKEKDKEQGKDNNYQVKVEDTVKDPDTEFNHTTDLSTDNQNLKSNLVSNKNSTRTSSKVNYKAKKQHNQNSKSHSISDQNNDTDVDDINMNIDINIDDKTIKKELLKSVKKLKSKDEILKIERIKEKKKQKKIEKQLKLEERRKAEQLRQKFRDQVELFETNNRCLDFTEIWDESMGPKKYPWEKAREIILQSCSLQEYPLFITNFKKLTAINLSCNDICALPYEFFTNVFLEHVNLADNFIPIINSEFIYLNELKTLCISNNRIRIVNKIFPQMTSITFLSLQGNPLVKIYRDIAYESDNCYEPLIELFKEKAKKTSLKNSCDVPDYFRTIVDTLSFDLYFNLIVEYLNLYEIFNLVMICKQVFLSSYKGTADYKTRLRVLVEEILNHRIEDAIELAKDALKFETSYDTDEINYRQENWTDSHWFNNVHFEFNITFKCDRIQGLDRVLNDFDSVSNRTAFKYICKVLNSCYLWPATVHTANYNIVTKLRQDSYIWVKKPSDNYFVLNEQLKRIELGYCDLNPNKLQKGSEPCDYFSIWNTILIFEDVNYIEFCFELGPLFPKVPLYFKVYNQIFTLEYEVYKKFNYSKYRVLFKIQSGSVKQYGYVGVFTDPYGENSKPYKLNKRSIVDFYFYGIRSLRESEIQWQKLLTIGIDSFLMIK